MRAIPAPLTLGSLKVIFPLYWGLSKSLTLVISPGLIWSVLNTTSRAAFLIILKARPALSVKGRFPPIQAFWSRTSGRKSCGLIGAKKPSGFKLASGRARQPTPINYFFFFLSRPPPAPLPPFSFARRGADPPPPPPGQRPRRP